MYENFDELFESVVKKTKKMTMFQRDCFLHSVYKEYKYMIGLKGYDEDTFFSLVYYNDTKLVDDNHVKRLMLVRKQYLKNTIRESYMVLMTMGFDILTISKEIMMGIGIFHGMRKSSRNHPTGWS